jgi:hypothetical protein
MAASSSKMLQIAGKTDTTADPKNPKTEKKQKNKTIPEPFYTQTLLHTHAFTQKNN